MGKEQLPGYYDSIYKSSAKYSADYRQLPYLSTWALVMQLVNRVAPNPSLLDLGCGPGQFAEFIIDHSNCRYTGVDFSEEAVAIAKEKHQPSRLRPSQSVPIFLRSDIFDPFIWEKKFDVYTLLETLEHLDRDLELLARIPGGAFVIISVPTFDDEGHVRFFKTPEEVFRRYGPYLGSETTADGKIVETIRSWFIIYGRRNTLPLPMAVSL